MYGKDLSFVHDAGFGGFAGSAAPKLIAWLRAAGVRRGARVVELGCGSGTATQKFILAGYQVLGIDISPDMIRLARKNAPKARLIVGRLPKAEIPRCDAVVAVGEVLNYMPRRADFDALFRRVHAALRPGGLFLFDIKLPSEAREPSMRGRFADDWAVLAESSEDARGRLTRKIVSFRRSGSTYRRSDETHRLTLLPASDLSRRLRAAGFVVRSVRSLIEARRP
jgi:SAM-dependent methyltransferase